MIHFMVATLVRQRRQLPGTITREDPHSFLQERVQRKVIYIYQKLINEEKNHELRKGPTQSYSHFSELIDRAELR
ncbi:hypothetical protein RHMOL_Rhmol07G0286200 [Rhododendron molle]|uniref:Uncharacterized protein n=1 Tax=Rhododendron molle TaxID=49168 RepID=A0ACC0N7I1_RHOML|nr:hypothetical protein RHMOL_Rhmol07G0286200 [Rhododendron molle]